MSSLRSALILLAVFVLSAAVCGQENPSERTERLNAEIVRKRTIISNQINDLRQDLSALNNVERARFAAKAARLVRELDKLSSDEFRGLAARSIEGSVKEAEKLSVRDGFNLTAAVEDILALDRNEGRRVILALLSLADDRRATFNDREGVLSDLLAAIAPKVVTNDPALAETLILYSLRTHLSSGVPAAVSALYRRDPVRASKVIDRIIQLTRNNFSSDSAQLLFNLDRWALELSEGKPFRSREQRLILGTFVANMIDAAAVEELRSARCGLSFFGARMKDRVRTILPERYLAFEQSLNLCLPYLNPSSRSVVAATDGIEPGTDISEILRQALTENDTEKKVRLFRLVFEKLRYDKAFEKLISILDGFEGDEFRKVSEVGWRSWRITASTGAVLTALSDGDIPAAHRILDKTPSTVRPIVRHQILIDENVDRSSQFWSEVLHSLVNELEKDLIPPGSTTDIYLDLTSILFPLRPIESLRAFEKAVKYINKADLEPPDEVYFAWAEDVSHPNFSSDLMSYDEIAISQALKDITSELSRVRLRLGLLDSSVVSLANLRADLQEAIKKVKD